MKHILPVLLLVVSLLSLIACNPTEHPDEIPEDNRSVVFRGEEIVLPEGWNVRSIPALSWTGDVLTAALRQPKEPNGNGSYHYDIASAQFVRAEDGFVFSAFADSQTARGKTFPLANGVSAVSYTEIDAYTAVMTLTFSRDDEELFVCFPANDMGYNLMQDVDNMAGTGFAVLHVAVIENGEAPLYAVLTTEGLCAYHADGTTAFTIRDTNDPTAIIVTDNRLLYLNRNREGVGTLRLVDTAAGKLTDIIPLPSTLVGNAMMQQPTLIGGGGYDLYAYKSNGLWGVDILFSEDGSHTSTAELVLDFMESGIVYRDLRGVCMIDAQTAVIAMQDFYDYDAPGTLTVYRMVPADQVPEKQEIVIASLCDNNPWSGSEEIIDFNLSSDTHRFVFRDYSTYPAEQRKTAFDTDIAAGKIPDIVLLEENAYKYLPTSMLEVYEKSPLFCDLKPYLMADDQFDYDDLFSCVTTAYEYNGTQRVFPLFRDFSMIFARTAEVSAPMTPDEYLAFAENALAADPERSLFASVSQYYPICAVIGERYDTRTAECQFDDAVLAAWIDRAAALGNGADVDREIPYSEQFRQGKLCFFSRYLPNSLYDYFCLMYELGADSPDDIAAVGYPSESRSLYAYDSGGQFFAITEQSQYKEECIDLLWAILSDHTLPTVDRTAQFYVNSHADVAEQLAAFDGMTLVYNDRYPSIYPDEEAAEMPGTKVKITAEWADAYTALMDSITHRITEYKTPEKLFYEEFRTNNGADTAEALRVIQSRISIYLSEQFE
ncbi:MAG: hypothetical protein E7604_08910 [Ruminococcaceae bacterium]|nr:hypothetical protein [Oscillospiraceae bacterium]